MATKKLDYETVIDTPVGRLGIAIEGESITSIDMLSRRRSLRSSNKPLARQAARELKQYFKGERSSFDLPVSKRGTDFQERVWRALRKIPFGKTVTYGQLADRLSSGARAVGTACRKNPVPIVVPCHRVVAKSGIGGYMGDTTGPRVKMKHELLNHEHGYR